MTDWQSWILTDVRAGLHVDSIRLSSAMLGHRGNTPWTIQKRTLHGGLSEGIEVIDVDAGALHFSVLPTRGMGIWRGSARGTFLGWHAPLRGPVHPQFVNPWDLSGLGWLAGFDEWIVRCGITSFGPPGKDIRVNEDGTKTETMLPLHGRIANSPAHYVEIRAEQEPPYALEIIGIVDESTMFFQQLRLRTVIRVEPGKLRLGIHDTVTNFRSQPAELQMMYHCNFGPPLLGEGSRFVAPIAEIAPRDPVSIAGMQHLHSYDAPKAGRVEEAFYMKLAESHGRSLALLVAPDGEQGCAVRFQTEHLPYFVLWKNLAAMSDGYVTGLEPATNFPNFKSFEREQGRVVSLRSGESYDMHVELEAACSKDDIERLESEVRELQRHNDPVIHAQPKSGWSPTA